MDEATPDLLGRLMPAGYKAKPEQVLLFKISAWDANCSQHIPLRFEAADVHAALQEKDERIAALGAELKALQSITV